MIHNTEIQKLKIFSDGTFSILITGEKGIGKSFLISKALDGKGVLHDCYNNIDFQNIIKDKIRQANATYLVIDHIENLKKEEQIALFNAIITKQGGAFAIFDPEHVSCQLIFVTNMSLNQLYGSEFYQPLIDRIAQQVIELSPLRKRKNEDLYNAYKSVWEQMIFKNAKGDLIPFQEPEGFFDWLKTLDLAGNFRDLEKIAILHWRFLIFNESSKKIFNADNVLQFVKNEYEKYNVKPENEFFRFNVNADEMIKAFRKQLVAWAEKVYEDNAAMLQALDISEKTCYNWKNGK